MENVQKSALPPQQGSPAMAPPLYSRPRLSCCWRAGLEYLAGLWPEILECSQALLCPRWQWCLSAAQHRVLSSSSPYMVSHEHQTSSSSSWGWALHQRSWIWCVCLTAGCKQCLAYTHEYPHGSVHRQHQHWGFHECGTPLCRSRQVCEGEGVSWETIPWHWGGWRWGGTRAQECSSQLCSELQLLWVLHPHGVTTLLCSHKWLLVLLLQLPGLLPGRAVGLSHRLRSPNKFGLCWANHPLICNSFTLPFYVDHTLLYSRWKPVKNW